MKYWLRDLVYHTTIVPRMKKLQRQLPDVKIFPFGSRYVCNPPIMNTDIDFLVYSKDDITSELERLGYKGSNSEYYGNDANRDEWSFCSWRKRKVNLVVSSSKKLIERDVIAAHICRRYNIKYKGCRIAVHEALRGNDPSGIETEAPFNPEMVALLRKLSGDNSNTMIKAYKAANNVSVLL